jgi:hypothetical protein
MVEPYQQTEDVQMNSQEMGMFTTHEVPCEVKESGPLFYQQRSRAPSGNRTVESRKPKNLL